ncbi:MAG: ABC transporter ATP-binding protein, partial [Oscillospiraceae bacterium]|nr:ABC transporter ATP-binding protein [Oscillospiraceae bacterium]
MSEYIIEMKNITKRFPGIVANDNVTIQIKKGEIYALLGENGAGKSTLMSMLFGMYEPDEGEIYVRGKKEVITSPSYATELNIGMVHQHFKLVSNYTIAENIIMGVEPIKKFMGFLPYVDIKTSNEKIAALSKEYGLEVDPTKKIEDITVSTQQRVEILKMLYREAEILIFDEPTAVLTPQEIEFLLEIIKGLKAAGKTIILITHKLEEIKKVADRCAILNRGKLIDVLDVATTSTKEMANKMVGREVSFEREKAQAKYGDVVLSVKDLTVKDANGFEVVKKASFDVRGGEIMAIAGVSGNGQVEIADAITGIMQAAGGTVTLNGKDITNWNIRKRNDEGIAYIPEDRQTYGLVLDFTLSDNLALKNYYQQPFANKGIIDHKKFDEFGDKLIDKYDIRSGQGIKTMVRSMSGGNQQKAIIAREVEQNAELIIFVQPTRGLDIGAIENIHNQIIA